MPKQSVIAKKSLKKETNVKKQAKTLPYIVAIGASAGGLEAIQDFFDEMSNKSGLAFVVIQHLAPDFKSSMDQLLNQNTKMRILHAVNKMQIEPNTIYLIPSNHNMTLKNGCLFLTK